MTEQTQEPQTRVQISLNDIAATVQIIDVCSKRGAFQGDELEAVGGVRGRLAAFVKANTPVEETSEEEGVQANDSAE